MTQLQKNYRKFAFLSVLILVVCTVHGFGQDIRSYLPLSKEYGAWQLRDTARVFIGEDLFTLIDGGAEVYLEYGFDRVVSAVYENPESQSIKLELYEMKDAPAAFGIFSLNRGSQGRPVPLGNEGLLYRYHIMFWKDRFLAYVSCSDTSEQTLAGVLALAAAIDGKIAESGTTPRLIDSLPSRDLERSVYFRGPIGLSSLYTFDTKNIFGVREGVLGVYPDHKVFIFRYEFENESVTAFRHVQQVLQTNERFENYRQAGGRCTMIDKKGAHLCAERFQNLIVVVLAASEEYAGEFLDAEVTFIDQQGKQ